ncbi:MAG: hypothetical protein EBT18_10255 [Gammaproteobacteria bacterium]|nr:hypothetical protein [Gammaproteobacteria bacterium]
MLDQTPINISTISELAGSGMTLALHCQPCGRWDEIVPAEWLENGRPDVNYIRQRFSCSVCGNVADKQVRASKLGMSNETAYRGI